MAFPLRFRGLAVLASGIVLALSFSPRSEAGVLLAYPFNDNADGNGGFDPATLDTGVLSGATISAGPGLGQFAVGADSWSGSVQVLKTGPGFDKADASAADALSYGWYFEVTLTPITTMDIGSIEFDWSRGGTTSTRGMFVRSSLDGYASDLYANETPAGTAVGLQHAAFDLGGHTGVAATVSFRFYIYTPRAGRFMDFQNLQFNTAPLSQPVPGGSGLLACGLGTVLGGQRRRR